jgi:hypothetical protein
MKEIPCEPGLVCYYENQNEFKERGLTEEEIAVRIYEIGYNIGRSEVVNRVKNFFKIDIDKLQAGGY